MYRKPWSITPSVIKADWLNCFPRYWFAFTNLKRRIHNRFVGRNKASKSNWFTNLTTSTRAQAFIKSCEVILLEQAVLLNTQIVLYSSWFRLLSTRQCRPFCLICYLRRVQSVGVFDMMSFENISIKERIVHNFNHINMNLRLKRNDPSKNPWTSYSLS